MCYAFIRNVCVQHANIIGAQWGAVAERCYLLLSHYFFFFFF